MRRRICEAAVKEFSEKGYINASTREIARGAGMTVGNLYRYFEDKEAIFCCVIGPAYESLMELVKQSLEQVKLGLGSSFFGELADQILKMRRKHKNELLILFNGSAGTRYEHAKDEMVKVVEGFLEGNIQEQLRLSGVKVEDVQLFRIIAAGFVDGMAEIFGKYENGDKLKRVAEQYIAFYFSNVPERFGH